MGNVQSVEVGEELTVSSSQFKDCNLSCSVQVVDAILFCVSHCLGGLPNAVDRSGYRLWPSGKASASIATDLGSIPLLSWIFSQVKSYQ